jgi:ankyrin repeat protein
MDSFLYAKLAMDAFVAPGSDATAVLKTLPADLNGMYNDLLREHTKQSNVLDDFQLLILQFITRVTRPLRLLELFDMAKASHVPFADYDLKEVKGLVRAACGPLLEILYDETVSVVHHSFTEFLKGFTRSKPLDHSTYPILEAGPTNQRLAIACMDYLMSGCLDNYEIKKRSKTDELLQSKKAQQSGTRLQFPFLEYAAANWHIHARHAAIAGADMSSFYKTLDDFVANDQRFIAWLDIDWPKNLIQGLTPLHVAARTELTQYARYLLQEKNADPNAKSDHGDPPLYWAALSGYADIEQLLINNGAEPDGEANEGYKPLHKAASRNRADVVKVLLAAGVDPLTRKTRDQSGRWCSNSPTLSGQTPWMYACSKGHTEAVAAFLPYIKDSENLLQGLFWSTGAGCAACVDLILQQPGVDVNSMYLGETPLFKACSNGDRKTIKVLIKAGADPNILCDEPQNDITNMNIGYNGEVNSGSRLIMNQGATLLCMLYAESTVDLHSVAVGNLKDIALHSS